MTKINTIFELLNKKKLNPVLDTETSQVRINFELGRKEIPIFFNILSNGLVFQSIAYLPIEVPHKYMADIARLLHILNKQLDLPGFGMDEKSGLLFFRVTIPSPDKTFSEDFLAIMLGASQLACDSFLSGIEMVANGTVSMDTIR